MYTDSFTDYLKNDKKASANTVEAYRRDIDGFRKYMEERGSSSYLLHTLFQGWLCL